MQDKCGCGFFGRDNDCGFLIIFLILICCCCGGNNRGCC